MTHEELLSEFCEREDDTLYSDGTRKRRSMLLELRKDIDFNLGIYGTFRVLNLNPSQTSTLVDLTPMLAVPLLYCSAIDLIARVVHKVTSVRGMNTTFFKESAVNFFELTADEAVEMWKLRNLLSHQYSIKDYTISRSGSSNVYEQHDNGQKVVFVRAMRGSLGRAASKLQEYLLLEDTSSREATKEFMDNYGFSYYLVV